MRRSETRNQVWPRDAVLSGYAAFCNACQEPRRTRSQCICYSGSRSRCFATLRWCKQGQQAPLRFALLLGCGSCRMPRHASGIADLVSHAGEATQRSWTDADGDRQLSGTAASASSWPQRRRNSAWLGGASAGPEGYVEPQRGTGPSRQGVEAFGVDSSVPEQIVPSDMWRGGDATAPATRRQQGQATRDEREPSRVDWGARRQNHEDDW